MKKILLLIFLLITFRLYAQNQIIELCEDSNNTFTYYAPGTPNCTYNWLITKNGSNIETFNTEKITFTFTKTGNYEITVYSENELCVSETQSYEVKVIECRVSTIYVPNSFTPNKDRLNDTWAPIPNNIKSMTVFVYTRWGSLVYKTDDPEIKWDGTFGGMESPVGVYIYYIEYTTVKNVYGYKVGTITLYR
jgi:gliding motility-associated-like protein